ncbi:Ubiquitin carboxyl-terminal hydrolase [Gracilaria domingensis]|nr:Ubiquitin carboxyl-terminal hydrolase [Gracilaria domingensis]
MAACPAFSSALGKRRAEHEPAALRQAPAKMARREPPDNTETGGRPPRARSTEAARRFATVLGKRRAHSPPRAAASPAKVARSEMDTARAPASPTRGGRPAAPPGTRAPHAAVRACVQQPRLQPQQHNGRAPARAMQSARSAHPNARSITSARSRQTPTPPQLRPPAPVADAQRAAMPDCTPPPSTPTPPSTPPPLPHPPGLLNLGNTCYINSVLQVLYNQPLFRSALACWTGPSSADFSCELAHALQSLFRTLDNTQLLQRETSRHAALPTAEDDDGDTLDTDPLDDLRENVDYVSPSAFVSILRDERCDFEAVGQQDAHEFLRFLLDKVDAALKLHPQAIDSHHTDGPQSPSLERSPSHQLGRLRGGEAAKHDNPDVPSSSVAAPIKAKGTELPRLAKRRRVSEASDALEQTPPLDGPRPRKRFRPTLVPDLFEGKAVTATRCDFCESMSNRAEQFLDVSLPVEAGRNLEWAWSKTGAKEKLVGVNKYSCDTCNTYTEAQRWWRVVTLPKVLTVHLKLFAFDSPYTSSGEKVAVAMPCPFEMRLSEWCTDDCEERDMWYRLSAVIVHEGNGASSGHYYSYIYRDDKAEWWEADHVKPLALTDSEHRKARCVHSPSTSTEGKDTISNYLLRIPMGQTVRSQEYAGMYVSHHLGTVAIIHE